MSTFIRHPKILDRNKSALLIIDIQEKIYKVVRKHEKLIENVLKLIKGFKILDLPIYYTEQYPKGLGPTISKNKRRISWRCYSKVDL